MDGSLCKIMEEMARAGVYGVTAPTVAEFIVRSWILEHLGDLEALHVQVRFPSSRYGESPS